MSAGNAFRAAHHIVKGTIHLIARIVVLITAITGHAFANDLTITNANIVDLENGRIIPDRTIIIRDGTITSVRKTNGNGGENLFDAKDAYVMAGLWDAHVHVFSSPQEPETALDLYLINGVTGIRDMGALLPLDRQKEIVGEIESGKRRGPRIVLSGAWVDASPGSWPGMFLADTPAEAKARVNEIRSQGWAAVKSYSMLESTTYDALAKASSAAGLPLVGHIPELVTLTDAIKAGQNGMEHFGRVTKACSAREHAMIDRVADSLKAEDPRSAMIEEMASHNAIILESWDEELCREVIARIAASGMTVAPTLIVSDFYTGKRPDDLDKRMALLPRAVHESWQKPDFRLDAMTDELRAIADRSIALDWQTFRMAHQSGVKMLASTDASYANPFIFHGFSLLDELDRYVEIGLTPLETLRTSMIEPPRFFRLADQDGTVAFGKRDDLVVISGNPMESLQTLRKPLAVVTAGRLFDRDALDEIERELLSNDAD